MIKTYKVGDCFVLEGIDVAVMLHLGANQQYCLISENGLRVTGKESPLIDIDYLSDNKNWNYLLLHPTIYGLSSRGVKEKFINSNNVEQYTNSGWIKTSAPYNNNDVLRIKKETCDLCSHIN